MIDERELGELLDYFRFDERDTEALSAMKSAFGGVADEFVNEFYVHLLRFPETQKLLRDRETRDRLLLKQREYLLSLTDLEIDNEYLESRERIGVAHERLGVRTRWYLGAYALYFNLLMPIIEEEFAHDRELREQTISALLKRLMLDAEIAIHQYIDRRETDLRRLNRELQVEGRALSREVNVAARNLRRTVERAQAAEQLASVATLVTGLAHEIGTPMGVIRGHAEALESAVEGERAEWRLRMILEQIDRITGIIQSLLNIARPKESMRVPLDLVELLDTSLAFLTEKLRRRAVSVERRVSAPGELGVVIGDPEKIQQVFLNLFINAIDAMPEGGVLTVSMACERDSEVTVRVADSGNGIPPDQLEAIFEPFYTTKAAGHGNGLGLVVVQGIVDEHQGSLVVTSEVGQGTEFAMHLPLTRSAPGGNPESDRTS